MEEYLKKSQAQNKNAPQSQTLVILNITRNQLVRYLEALKGGKVHGIRSCNADDKKAKDIVKREIVAVSNTIKQIEACIESIKLGKMAEKFYASDSAERNME